MANNNQIELVVTVEVDKANQSIKSVNANLSGIEAAATKSARAASHGIDGMTVAMAKGAAAGHLLAEAIHKVIEFAKEWTIEAAKEAAHQERAVAITRALAKSHGDGAAAAQKAIEAIRQVGYATADATTSVQKLIIADIGLDKATSLAKIAKDAAAVNTEGLDAAQAFEKLMLAIETGQSRGLRTMSLFPKMAEAEEIARLEAQLHGKTLTDLEVKQVRYNAIVEASKTIQGSAAEAAGTFDGQMKKLSRELKDLKEDVGKAFQSELMLVVGLLKGVVGLVQRPHRRHREVRQGHARPGRDHRHDHGGDQGVGARARRAQPRDGGQPGLPARGRHHRRGRDHLERVLRHAGGDGRPLQADGDGRAPEGVCSPARSRWTTSGSAA